MMPTVAACAVTRHRIMVWDSFWLPCEWVCGWWGEVVSLFCLKQRRCLSTPPFPPHIQTHVAKRDEADGQNAACGRGACV